MRIFVDTEFNSYKGDLISMALVDNNGGQFYVVLPFHQMEIDPWVSKNVIPVLCKQPALTIRAAQKELESWLSEFTSIRLIADWPEDIAHFCNFLITGPGERINTPPITIEIRRDLDCISKVPHNALWDAIAIRDKYNEITS